MKIWMNIYSLADNGNLYAEEEVSKSLKYLPRSGDLICIESFFPDAISGEWERTDSILPFGTVRDVVFHKDTIHIDIEA